jgi:hypothetical protein
MRRDGHHRWIRALDHRDEALISRALEIRGETGDVVRAPDGNAAGAALPRHASGRVERAPGEPRSGQAIAVPDLRGGPAGDHRGLTGLRHSVVRQLVEIQREQRETVRRVAEQVTVEQHVGDIARDVGARPPLDQRLGELAQLLGPVPDRSFIARRHGGTSLSKRLG